MSTSYEQNGRTGQKRRTREALIDGARSLLASGAPFTVEGAADAAGISRATAYRYFPNRRALLGAAHPVTETVSLLPADAPDDPWERLSIVVDRFLTELLHDEVQQRTTLRLSLEHDPHELPLRQGRAIPWLTEALSPLEPELGEVLIRRMVHAIRTAIGIEALVWLVDVAGLDRDTAVDQMRWAVRAIYEGARGSGERTS